MIFTTDEHIKNAIANLDLTQIRSSYEKMQGMLDNMPNCRIKEDLNKIQVRTAELLEVYQRFGGKT